MASFISHAESLTCDKINLKCFSLRAQGYLKIPFTASWDRLFCKKSAPL